MITYLLLAFARHSAETGWTVQRILRVFQLNLFERRNLSEILKPDPSVIKRISNKIRFMTVNYGTAVHLRVFFIYSMLSSKDYSRIIKHLEISLL